MTTQVTPPRTNILALVGFITAFVVPIAGLVLGIVARNQLTSPGNIETGRGFARWAMIIGSVGTALGIVFIGIWLSLFITALNNAPLYG